MQAVSNRIASDAVEMALVQGDLKNLSTEQRVEFYQRTCHSLGLNPLTQPFSYLNLNGKLSLYARKDCTDQLRTIHEISVLEMSESEREGVYVVTAKVGNKAGRTDMAKGAVNIKGLIGEALANALMKAETKAKRRATLSICGLGWLDETETDTIPRAETVSVNEAHKPAAINNVDAEAIVREHAKRIEEAETIEELKTATALASRDKRISGDDKAKLGQLKDERKSQLAKPAPAEDNGIDEPPVGYGMFNGGSDPRENIR